MSSIPEETKCDSTLSLRPWDIYTPGSLNHLSLNELMSLSSSLQQNYNIDYAMIFETSKKLKTLD